MMNARSLRAALGCATSLAALLLYSPRAAAADSSESRASWSPEALGNHQKNVRVELGLRTQFIHGAGFDPFDENDVLNQLSLGASWAFWAHDRWSLAGFVGFDYGRSSAKLRSDQASLDARRFVLAPELRYHVWRLLALTAKVGPTLTREAATVSGALDTDLSKIAWRFGVDATAGLAFEVAGYGSGTSRTPRLWVTGEGGYGWTAPLKLKLKPDEASQAPQRLTPLELGELSLGGPLFRITAALSFW